MAKPKEEMEAKIHIMERLLSRGDGDAWFPEGTVHGARLDIRDSQGDTAFKIAKDNAAFEDGVAFFQLIQK